MKKTLTIFFAAAACFANSQTFSWSQKSTFKKGDQVVIDSVGNLFVTGHFGNTYPSWSSTIKKFDNNGNLLWETDLPFTETRIAVDKSGNSYLSGVDTNGYYILRFSEAGVFTNKTLVIPAINRAQQGQITGIHVDNSNNVIVSGLFKGTLHLGNSELNGASTFNTLRLFVAKFNSEIKCLWAKCATNGHFYTACSFADKNGNTIVGGETIDTVAIAQLQVPGNPTSPDAFICLFDSNGTCKWLKSVGTSTGQEFVSALCGDGEGNFYAAGYFDSNMTIENNSLSASGINANIFLWKISLSGQTQWAKQFGGSVSEYAHSLSSIASRLYLTGTFSGNTKFDSFLLSSNAGNPNMEGFALCTDLLGNSKWAITLGGVNGSDSKCFGSCADQQGLYITGTFSGSINFGIHPQSANESSLFVAKIIDEENLLLKATTDTPIITIVKVFPNPTQKFIDVSFDAEHKQNITVELRSVDNKLLFFEELEKLNGTYQRRISLEGASGGTYMLKIFIDGALYTTKIIRN